MKRLSNGLTPRETADQLLRPPRVVLGDPGLLPDGRIDESLEHLQRRRQQPIAYLPQVQATIALEHYADAVRRLVRAERQLRVAEVAAAVATVAVVALVGLRLLGL